MRYLGHLLTKDGIKPDPEKVSAIVDMSPPTDKKGVHRLIGMLKYLSRFLPNFSDQSKPLRDLLREDVLFVWLPEHQQVFEHLKSAIVSAPVLCYFDPQKPVTIQTDSSSSGLGSCLLQEGKPVAFASRALSTAETHYAQIEKELLAIVFACEKFYYYIYGRQVAVQSDHKPLEAIFQKPLASTTPRLQRMLLKLLRFNLRVIFTPGKNMFIADTLSRAYLESQPSVAEREIADDIEVMVHSILHEFPASSKKLEEFRRETDADADLFTLKQYLRDGVGQSPPTLKQYSRLMSDIYELDGMLFLNERIVVPQSMRRSILMMIHEGHLGIEKCKSMARQCVYWPGINRDIEHVVSSCSICQAHRHRQSSEPLMPHPVPQRPWQKLGVDIFSFSRHDYLLVIDYYSKYPEVVMLSDKTASTVVQSLKSIFARHGIPDEVFSDNNPFNSACMRSFAREWNFNLSTSSPTYPQSNGMVERSIQTVKSLLRKAADNGGDPYTALLQYRNAPISDLDGLSPAQLLFSRRLKTKLPVTAESLEPETQRPRNKLIARQERQKKYFDRTAHNLPSLKPRDVIRVYKDGKLQQGVVRHTLDAPRSYVVSTETGAVIRRNRRDLIRTRETAPVCCSPMDDFDPPSSPGASEQKCASSASASQSVSSSTIPSPTTVATSSASLSQSQSTSGIPTVTTAASHSSILQPATTGHVPVMTRSGRISVPPARFKDFVD